jgi:tetratricopeptide (TPR) repeat protein
MTSSRRADLVGAVAVALPTVLPLLPIAHASFLNWDDDAIFLRNPPLTSGAVVPWAFTTTHMGHYQPLSWMVWASIVRRFGAVPEPFHLLNLATHAAAAALVFMLALELAEIAGGRRRRTRFAAALGALVFGVHPMRVEPVAWASAFPYLAALVFALLAVLAYVQSRRIAWTTAAALKGPRDTGTRLRPAAAAIGWSVVAIACFAISLGFRPIAVGLPFILLLLDWYPLHAAHRQAGRHRIAPLVADKVPYLLLAIAAIGLEWFARRHVGFNEIGAPARLALVGSGPFVYLWRTIAPFGLSPVSVLPIDPQGSMVGVVGAVATGAVSAAAWGLRDRRPALLALWAGYLLLVAPTVGLAPTGLQAVADRYAYLPAVAVAIAAAACGVTLVNHGVSFRPFAAVGAAVITMLGVLTWNQTAVWHDSIALWTRAAEADPGNDVAFYNLGTALQDAGREDDAVRAYEATLRLVPDHIPARQNLDRLRAIARQREADALSRTGNLAAAIPIYRDVLALDPRRSRARAALGIALARTGEFDQAVEELHRAIEQGVDDPAVFNAAGFALVQTGRTADAVRLLEEGRARHPEDADIRRNLEMLRSR